MDEKDYKDITDAAGVADATDITGMMPDRHVMYMREALREAELAARDGEVPVGAVVVRLSDGEIVSRGHNRCEAASDPTAHAEMLAIRAAAQANGHMRLQGHVIYATLEPCPMCAGAIAVAGLDAVYYGARDADRGCCGSVYRLTEDAALHVFTRATGGILEDECKNILVGFMRGIRLSKIQQ